MNKIFNTQAQRHRGSQRGFILCILCVSVLSIFVSACGELAPVTPAPQLAWTPGPPVIVTDDFIQTAAFTLHYPRGWRVITGEAAAPVSIIIVAPDDTRIMQFSAAPIDPDTAPPPILPPETPAQTDFRSVTLPDGVTVYAYASAASDDWEAFLPIFEGATASLLPAPVS